MNKITKKECKKKRIMKDIKVLLKKKQSKKKHYGYKRFENLPKNEKQSLVEYQNNNRMRKSVSV